VKQHKIEHGFGSSSNHDAVAGAEMDILEVMTHGSQNVETLGRASNLRETAEKLLRVLDDFPGYGVVAASPAAERVIGAAMMLRNSVHSDRSGSLIIFDINIASGTLMARAARRLRDAGNRSQLLGVALHAIVHQEAGWRISGLDDLLLVEPMLESRSLIGQLTKCGDGSIMLAS
jgi:hypothetical protein